MLPDDAATPSSPSLLVILSTALMLPQMALQQLFVLPGDALPQGITRLTGLTHADVRRFVALKTAEQYDQVLRHEAALFYYYALAGWLAYQSVLGEAIRMQLPGAADSVAAAELVTESTLGLLAGCVATPTHATVEALHALFAREKHGLVPSLPALLAMRTPTEPAPGDAEVWLRMKPEPDELALFGLALSLTQMASLGVPHPLGQALKGVAALGPKELTALYQCCQAAQAEATPELVLTGLDVIRLYLSLQVLALLFVADLQPDLMRRLDPTLEEDGPWTDPDQQQEVLTWVCTQVDAQGGIFDDLFGEKPSYQAAQATARALAALV